jgi:hypothetical protein
LLKSSAEVAKMVIRKEIPDLLFATSRPGYDYGANAPVSPEVVSQWIAEVESMGAKSIICLLNEQELGVRTGGQGSFSFTANDSRFIHRLDLSQIEKKVSVTCTCFVSGKMKGNEP